MVHESAKWFCNFTLIGFFEKLCKLCNTNLIGQRKVPPTKFYRNVVQTVFNFGVEGEAHFFELECEQLACSLTAVCWQNSKSIEQRCSVSQTLVICCESGTVSMTRLFESGVPTRCGDITICNGYSLCIVRRLETELDPKKFSISPLWGKLSLTACYSFTGCSFIVT